MRWRKLGRVFCPDGSVDWMASHASVPFAQALAPGLFRVYFSPRDTANRSRIVYLDMALDEGVAVTGICERPVLEPGDLGTFDEAGTMMSWIVRQENVSYLYYIGWNLGVTVPFRNAIGLATSTDGGRTFQKVSRGPILDRSVFDPCFTASSCVLVEEGVWRMWYLSCVGWQKTADGLQHAYHIKYAESGNGVDWRRDGTVCIDFKNSGEYAISRPCVVRDADGYRMWYSYRGHRYRIGLAESGDGIRWRRRDADAGIDVSDAGWDSDMIEYPCVFDAGARRYMLYNGNGYGRTGFGLAVLEDAR